MRGWGSSTKRKNRRRQSYSKSKDKKPCGQAAHTARHVAWPFDWPHRRPRSSEAWLFYEKPLIFLGNQPVLQRLSQNILQITPQIIFKSTRSPERMSSGFFAKKPFLLSKINPHSRDTLSDFFENLLKFFSNRNTGPPWLYLFFPKKYMWPVARAHGRARRTSHVQYLWTNESIRAGAGCTHIVDMVILAYLLVRGRQNR